MEEPDEIENPVSSTLEILDLLPESTPYDESASVNGDASLTGQDCGYQSSASSTQQSGSDARDGSLDDEQNGLNSRASSRSSISSMPGSVLTHAFPYDGIKPAGIARNTHEQISHDQAIWDDHDFKGSDKMEVMIKPMHAMRHRESAFRKPSSVRAMQMHTEDEGDDDFLTPPKRRGAHGHPFSDMSIRSTMSSPTKRSPFYSPTGSGSTGRQKVKKEYPLVLLHCTLLPPSLPVPGLTGPPDQKVLKEVLPTEYWRRWKLLEEKVGSGMLRDRGVLISHPEDMYDLLEERLLQSLELQRPRFDHGHFLAKDDGDSEREDLTGEESATDDEQGEKCLDCGGRVVRHRGAGRKWEIKVFAANGLMRAGAWAAAWKEMEKVDVEVGLWLPSEVRRELEKRLVEDERCHIEDRLQVPVLQLQEPVNEITPEPQHHHSADRPMLVAPERVSRAPSPVPEASAPQSYPKPDTSHLPPKTEVEIDLQTLLINYLRVLANDRRNIAIALLSIVVAFLAIDSRPRPISSDLRPFPQDMMDNASPPTISVGRYSSAGWESYTSSATQSLESLGAPIPDASDLSVPSAALEEDATPVNSVSSVDSATMAPIADSESETVVIDRTVDLESASDSEPSAIVADAASGEGNPPTETTDPTDSLVEPTADLVESSEPVESDQVDLETEPLERENEEVPTTDD